MPPRMGFHRSSLCGVPQPWKTVYESIKYIRPYIVPLDLQPYFTLYFAGDASSCGSPSRPRPALSRNPVFGPFYHFFYRRKMARLAAVHDSTVPSGPTLSSFHSNNPTKTQTTEIRTPSGPWKFNSNIGCTIDIGDINRT